MRRIDPHTIYTMEETKDLLSPHVNYETLRAESDLVTMPGGGLWGRDLIAAIDQIMDRRRRKRGGASRSSDQEQDHHEEAKATPGATDHPRELDHHPTKGAKLEGARASGRPRLQHPKPRREPVADQRGKLRRLASQAVGGSAESGGGRSGGGSDSVSG